MITRGRVGMYAALGALGGSLPGAFANNWPPASQVIRMVVPFTAGGTTDILGRLMAEGLRKELGINVVVENIAGANGTLAPPTSCVPSQMGSRSCWARPDR